MVEALSQQNDNEPYVDCSIARGFSAVEVLRRRGMQRRRGEHAGVKEGRDDGFRHTPTRERLS
jgi:hypothetical protein